MMLEDVKARSEFTLAGKNVAVKTENGTIKFKVAQSRTLFPSEDGTVLYVHSFTQRIAGIDHIQITRRNKVVYPKTVLSFKVLD